MARHFERALSTLSVKVASLESQGLLTCQPDERDGRRVLIWLSPGGRTALAAALNVLDIQRLSIAGASLSAAQRHQLLFGLRALISALPAVQTQPRPNRKTHHEPALEMLKACLETTELILRGERIKWRFGLHQLQDLAVVADSLQFVAEGEPIALQLGSVQATQWLKKISTPPPSLAAKLGVRPIGPPGFSARWTTRPCSKLWPATARSIRPTRR